MYCASTRPLLRQLGATPFDINGTCSSSDHLGMNEKLGHVIKLDAEDSAFVLYKALVKEILNGDIMQYILVNIVLAHL